MQSPGGHAFQILNSCGIPLPYPRTSVFAASRRGNPLPDFLGGITGKSLAVDGIILTQARGPGTCHL
jgi:hypothetical protein